MDETLNIFPVGIHKSFSSLFCLEEFEEVVEVQEEVPPFGFGSEFFSELYWGVM